MNRRKLMNVGISGIIISIMMILICWVAINHFELQIKRIDIETSGVYHSIERLNNSVNTLRIFAVLGISGVIVSGVCIVIAFFAKSAKTRKNEKSGK